MKINSRVFVTSLWVALLFLPGVAMAFNFVNSSATANLNASAIPANLGNITSGSSDGARVNVNGNPTNGDKDVVRIQSVTIGPTFMAAGFTVEVGIGGVWYTSAAAVGRCVWYGTNCNVSQSSGKNNDPTTPVTIRLKRDSTAAYSNIPSGTTIASIVIRQYSNWTSGNNGGGATLIYKLNGELVPLIPTCDIKNFDNTVTLPGAMRADMVNHGAGRYTAVTKEFNINLECENSPKVSVTFNGDKMPGVASEDVLVNKLSGNDNVGIQLVYKNSALKIGENVEVLSAATTSENLKFNAYYYYKGGAVQSGPIKANSEFTFTYQ